MTLTKKIASLSLVIALIFNLTVFAVADYNDNASDASMYAEAIEKLKAFGIIELKENELFYPEENMSRAEFIAFALKAGGYDADLPENSQPGFSDVREDLWYSSYIKRALELGLISGTGGYFYPDEAIKLWDALKIVLNVMGYEYLAQSKGGYPYGYLIIAREIDLLTGLKINSNSLLTRGEAAQLLANALEGDALKVTNIKAGGIGAFEKESLLISRHNICMKEGVVTENSITALGADSRLGKGMVKIDDEFTYEAGNTNAESLLGYKVKYAYRLDNSKPCYTLLYIKKLDTNKEITIKASDIIEAKAGYVEVSEEGQKTQRFNISPNAYVIYNGKYITRFSSDMLKPHLGSLTLISNDNSAEYNVVLIEEYTNIVISDKNNDTLTCYDKYVHGKKVSLLHEGFSVDFEIIGAQGQQMKFEDIKAGQVISVYESQDNRYLKLVVSDTREQGIISQISDDNKLQIGEREFELTEEYKGYLQSAQKELKAGQEVILMLDAAGYVAGHEIKAKSDVSLAYLVNAALSPGVDPKLSVKLFTTDAIHKIYTCASKVELDGTIMENHKEIFSKLAPGGNIKNTLIAYRVNSENELIYIDTPAKGDNEEESNTLFMASTCYTWSQEKGYVKEGTPLTYKNKTMAFSFKVLIDESVPIFVVPNKDASTADEKVFGIKSASDYSNDAQVYIESYQLNRDSFIADALIVYEESSSGTSVDNDSTIAVVSKISRVLIDGEEKEQITALQDGKVVTLIPKDEFTFHNIRAHSKKNAENQLWAYRNFQVGDVFRYKTLPDGTVSAVQMILGTVGERTGTAIDPMVKEAAYNEEANREAQARFVVRNVYSKGEGCIRLTPGDPSAVDADSQYSLETHKASNYQIMVVEKKDKNKSSVRKGGVQDIRDFKTTGSSYSTVLIQTRYGDPRSIVVFDPEIYIINR